MRCLIICEDRRTVLYFQDHWTTSRQHRISCGCFELRTRSIFVDVSAGAAIIPYDQREHFCVGDAASFHLEGIAPWVIGSVFLWLDYQFCLILVFATDIASTAIPTQRTSRHRLSPCFWNDLVTLSLPHLPNPTPTEWSPLICHMLFMRDLPLRWRLVNVSTKTSTRASFFLDISSVVGS